MAMAHVTPKFLGLPQSGWMCGKGAWWLGLRELRALCEACHIMRGPWTLRSRICLVAHWAKLSYRLTRSCEASSGWWLGPRIAEIRTLGRTCSPRFPRPRRPATLQPAMRSPQDCTKVEGTWLGCKTTRARGLLQQRREGIESLSVFISLLLTIFFLLLISFLLSLFNFFSLSFKPNLHKSLKLSYIAFSFIFYSSFSLES